MYCDVNFLFLCLFPFTLEVVGETLCDGGTAGVDELRNCGETSARWSLGNAAAVSKEETVLCEEMGRRSNLLGDRNGDMGSALRAVDVDSDILVHLERNACYTCKRTFKTLNGLKRHQSVHSSERPFKCFFEGCKKAYRFDSDLKRHCKVHSEGLKFTCKYSKCGERFEAKSELYSHFKQVHKEQMFRCRNYACSFSSRTKKGLTNHVDKCAIARLEVIKEMEKQRDFSSQTQLVTDNCGIDTCK